ncbi:hypothetical protein [Lysobacter sp. 22409]|uniref:hypothetical protein n=1 Tax=Lysobacter sp. 22409 TaxID=3453917 RepID=UPI003F87D673
MVKLCQIGLQIRLLEQVMLHLVRDAAAIGLTSAGAGMATERKSDGSRSASSWLIDSSGRNARPTPNQTKVSTATKRALSERTR